MPSARRNAVFERGPWIAAGALAAFGAAVWFAARQSSRHATVCPSPSAMIRDFAASIRATDLSDDVACRAALARIEAEREKWLGYSTEPEVREWRARMVKAIHSRDAIVCFKPRNEFMTQYNALTAIDDTAEQQTSEVLRKALKTAVDLLAWVVDDPADAQGKLNAIIIRIDHALVPRMRDEANALATISSTTPSQGLAKYAAAEDYIRKSIDDAKRSKNKADEDAFTAVYKDLLQDSDAYAQRVLTPEFIDAIPWKDLLADGSKWSRVTNVPGFSCRVTNGVLGMTPPDAGSKLLGIAGILDQPGDNLRHFVLDMEFAVEGTVTAYFHVCPPPGSPNSLQSETLDLIGGPNGFKPGAKATLLVTYIGSHISALSPDDSGMVDVGMRESSWTKRRRGGIAFVIPAGTHLTVTRMRIKELR